MGERWIKVGETYIQLREIRARKDHVCALCGKKIQKGERYHRPTTHSKIPICSECVEKRGLSPEKVAEEIERRIPRAKSVGELFKLLILYDTALKEAKKKREPKQ